MNEKNKRYPNNHNRENMVTARKQYKSMSVKLQRKHDFKETEKLLNARITNVKLYWKMLANSKTKKSSCPLDTKDLYNHFLKLSDPEDEFFNADPDVCNDVECLIADDIGCVFEELNVAITSEEVFKSIKQLKNGKSGGSDLLLNEFFICGSDILCPYLLSLFNFIFDSGIYPEAWGEGLLVPLHKKGSHMNPLNYRGITLLSVLGKLFTRLLNNRLDDWAEKYRIYIEAQNGFRRGRGTVDSAFILSNIISSFLENGKKLYAFFVDYSKAFDFVVHDNLWYKLLKLGLRGKIIHILRSMYSCMKTKVFNNCEKSEPFECKLGVRQGECLSPFLFAMYVNDLESHLCSPDAGITIDDVRFLLLLYADDLVIFSESPDALQLQINKMYEYCHRWKLRINAEKSKIVVFKKGNQPVPEQWSYGNETIPVCTRIPYLGLLFSSNGLFSKTQSTLAEQANKAVFHLHRVLVRFKRLPLSAILDLFDKLVTPILCYGCELWGFHTSPDIERVHLSFCKRILCVKKSSQNDFVYGLLGRYPMQITRHCRIISYWLKIVSGNKPLYVNHVYQSAVTRMTNTPSRNWAYDVKQLLCTSGFGDVWYNQGVSDPESFIKAFKCRLCDMFNQTWSGRLYQSPRARFFRSIIDEHTFHTQLDMIQILTHRVAFARLVTSSHRLKVETGRWTRPVTPVEERLCDQCQKLDDEYHFLLECNKFSVLRTRFIPRYFYVRPSMFKCVQLINSMNCKIVRQLGKYIYHAFSQYA